MENTVYAGFDRQVITPDEPIPLAGYSNEPQRFHTAVTEDICATCIAVTDSADTTFLMIGVDFVSILKPIGQTARERLSAVTGVPQERIYIAATHTHSAPGLRMQEYPCIQRYLEKCYEKMELAARNAMADRKTAKLYTGSIETENMNFVKHYKVQDYVTGEISYIGDQFGTQTGKILLDHATRADPTMHILKLEREGAKSIVICNFRAHPHFTGGYKRYDLSSDYIGAFRVTLEAMYDCHAAYFQGACGNINSSTRMSAQRRFTTCRSYGAGLAAYAQECLHKYMVPVESGAIRTTQAVFRGALYRAPEKLVEPARMVRKVWTETFDRAKCVELGEPYGIRSPYHAGAILASQDRPPESGDMVISAVAIGDSFAFVTFPGEMFDSISVRMEETSPFQTTMMLGYCHETVGYLPSAVAYKYTSYETDITRFQAGTGEQVADFQVQLLKGLKGE